MDSLILDLKKELIERLNLEGMTPEDIADDMPLFGEGLGLDSIDALEIIVLLDKNYHIKITDPKEGRKIFHSVKTIAEYITEQRALAAANLSA
ncbi:MAG: acyl carrier protein [Bacteroidetes bacterium]|nr:acyl carrier protein [Bacteroidota bacterium]